MREWISDRISLAAFVVALAGVSECSVAVAEETGNDAPAKSLETLLATPSYSIVRYNSLGQMALPDEARATASAIPSIDFRDGSTLGRLKSIRQLSLLTISDSGRSRVYVGVNGDGIFGLHISFINGRQNDRFAEVMRMPYLRKSEQQQ